MEWKLYLLNGTSRKEADRMEDEKKWSEDKEDPIFYILDAGINVKSDDDEGEGEPVIIIATTWYPSTVKLGYLGYNSTPAIFACQFRLQASEFPHQNCLYRLEGRFKEYMISLGLEDLMMNADRTSGWYFGRTLKSTTDDIPYISFLANFLEASGYKSEFVPPKDSSIPAITSKSKYERIMGNLREEFKRRTALLNIKR